MDSGPSTKHHDPAPIKVRAPRLAGIQFSEDSVTNELRTLFLREVERATPEVLEKLRQKVWPEYIKAYEAIQQSGFTPTRLLDGLIGHPAVWFYANQRLISISVGRSPKDCGGLLESCSGLGEGSPPASKRRTPDLGRAASRNDPSDLDSAPGLDVKGCAVVAFGRVQVGPASATRLSNQTTPFHMVLAIRLRKCAGRKKAHSRCGYQNRERKTGRNEEGNKRTAASAHEKQTGAFHLDRFAPDPGSPVRGPCQAIGSRARNGQECSDGPQGRNRNQPAKGQAEENVM